MTAAGSNLTYGGVLLASTDPARLAAWYRALLEPLGAHWETQMLVTPDRMYVGFDRRDDIAGRTAEPGRQIVNFGVRDIQAARQHLDGLDVHWIRPVETTEFGVRLCTIEDPDGNYVQFVQAPQMH